MQSRGMTFISKRDAWWQSSRWWNSSQNETHAHANMSLISFHISMLYFSIFIVHWPLFKAFRHVLTNFFFFGKHLKKRRTHMHICPWHNFSYATYLYFHISVLWLIYYDVMPHSILCHGWCVSVTWRLWNDSCISAPRLMQLSHAIFLIDLSAMVYVFLCQNSDIFQGHDSCICTQ